MSKKSKTRNKMAYTQDIRSGTKFCIEKLMPKFESKKMARKESRIRQKTLKKSQIRKAAELSIKLAECRDYPCYSPACPVCARQFRRWFYSECRHLFDQYENAYFLTLIFYGRMIDDKELMNVDLSVIKHCLRKQLDRSGFIDPVIGSLEFDYHAESGLWLPHFHLMVLGDDMPIKELRKRFYKGNQFIEGRMSKKDRPMRLDMLKDKPKQISYLYKSYWGRIEAYHDNNGNRHTRKVRLKPRQLCGSLIYQDKFTFSDFLFLYKLRRNGSGLTVSTVNEREDKNVK